MKTENDPLDSNVVHAVPDVAGSRELIKLLEKGAVEFEAGGYIGENGEPVLMHVAAVTRKDGKWLADVTVRVHIKCEEESSALDEAKKRLDYTSALEDEESKHDQSKSPERRQVHGPGRMGAPGR